ncbi:MAG TPA: FAD-linked oxidase C-terminal domain-containing protein [Acidimicrobiales bacterium]|nr:FAD-linked oxidase C-terminal domain-containing protein [Acidimicrobiales bacterium]
MQAPAAHDVFAAALPADRILPGDANDDYAHDEALNSTPVTPRAVLLPETTDEVARILRTADDHRIPVTARGSGTGLSGAAVPHPDGIVISFERMKRIEIDVDNQVAIVQPGVTLQELDKVTAEHGLTYPVYPGEYSASLGGNVATNAGGMRAVKYGVTRHQVLGLEAVLASGDVIRTGGRFVKGSTGYDLTQLIIGSEGTLAVVTEAILRLYPRPDHSATVLAPYRTLDEVMHAVPRIVASGIGPLIVEYIDLLTMGGMVKAFDLDLGVPQEIQDEALAYLVIVMENAHESRLDEDVQQLAQHMSELGAMDVYVLPSGAGQRLIEAREKAFWLAKGAGADDIIDIVVPRASIADYMAAVKAISDATGTFVAGCGHAGDGNVHLSVYKADPDERSAVLKQLFEAGMALGGVISGEHGIGTTKRKYFLELEDPVKLDVLRRIKAAFDPNDILNPGTVF